MHSQRKKSKKIGVVCFDKNLAPGKKKSKNDKRSPIFIWDSIVIQHILSDQPCEGGAGLGNIKDSAFKLSH